MGYISSGDTTSIVVYLTQFGREILLKGDKNRFKIKYFVLGDSDTNYKIENTSIEGFTPDITGNSDQCIKPISSNIDVKYKIIL